MRERKYLWNRFEKVQGIGGKRGKTEIKCGQRETRERAMPSQNFTLSGGRGGQALTEGKKIPCTAEGYGERKPSYGQTENIGSRVRGASRENEKRELSDAAKELKNGFKVLLTFEKRGRGLAKRGTPKLPLMSMPVTQIRRNPIAISVT